MLLVPPPPTAAAAGASPPPCNSSFPPHPRFAPLSLLSSSLRSPAAAATGCLRPLSALPRLQRGRRREGHNTAAFSGDEEDEEEEEDGEGGWLERKPRGFGAGKSYDTSVEEQLLRGMGTGARQGRKSRKGKEEGVLAKRHAAAAAATTDGDASTSCIHVRIWNLPKKKNIHRDLRLAFKGFPGLISIDPVVSGNKKTRDPICKGFALLGMESSDAATRFVELYSKKTIPFGKVEKQISCCVVDPPGFVNSSSQASPAQLPFLPEMDNQIRVAADSFYNHAADTPYIISSNGSVDSTLDDESEDEALLVDAGGSLSDIECATTGAHQMTLLISDGLEGDNKTEVSKEPALSSKRETEDIPSMKKRTKQKPAMESNLSLPGSISRSRFKEKAMLAGVLSKYSGNAAVSSAPES